MFVYLVVWSSPSCICYFFYFLLVFIKVTFLSEVSFVIITFLPTTSKVWSFCEKKTSQDASDGRCSARYNEKKNKKILSFVPEIHRDIYYLQLSKYQEYVMIRTITIKFSKDNSYVSTQFSNTNNIMLSKKNTFIKLDRS